MNEYRDDEYSGGDNEDYYDNEEDFEEENFVEPENDILDDDPWDDSAILKAFNRAVSVKDHSPPEPVLDGINRAGSPESHDKGEKNTKTHARSRGRTKACSSEAPIVNCAAESGQSFFAQAQEAHLHIPSANTQQPFHHTRAIDSRPPAPNFHHPPFPHPPTNPYEQQQRPSFQRDHNYNGHPSFQQDQSYNHGHPNRAFATSAYDARPVPEEVMSNMLLSWYESGYHTGYFRALQDMGFSTRSSSTTENQNYNSPHFRAER